MNLWLNLLLIGLAGATGALARYGISMGMKLQFGDHFPLGTLLVNITGCFLLGTLLEFLDENSNKQMREIIGVGFLGALTTFSTFGVETVNKANQGQLVVAAANVGANLLLGLAFAALGIWVGRWLSGQS